MILCVIEQVYGDSNLSLIKTNWYVYIRTAHYKGEYMC